MKFSINIYSSSFGVSLLPSSTPVNYPDMPEGVYDWKKPIVYDSLFSVKKSLRESFNQKKMTESERYWIKENIKDLTIESVIDEELEAYTGLEKKYNELTEVKKAI